jgi:hypothetical protein
MPTLSELLDLTRALRLFSEANAAHAGPTPLRDDNVKVLTKADLFRIPVPRRHGGYQTALSR